MARIEINKKVLCVGKLHDKGEERAYWRSKTPQERLQAIQIMREVLYGEDASSGRLQRVLEIAQLKAR
jgi:hypothetical protein